MSLYERAKRGLGILALAGASYVGSSSLESRVYAAEPNESVQVPGGMPANSEEAINNLFLYDLNGQGVIDRGRNLANNYFAKLSRVDEKYNPNQEIKLAELTTVRKDLVNAFGKLDAVAWATFNEYASILGSNMKDDSDLIKSRELRFRQEQNKKVTKQNALLSTRSMGYALIDLVDKTESMEETTRRLKWLKENDVSSFELYKRAINNLDLVLVPGGIEFYLGTETKQEVDDILIGSLSNDRTRKHQHTQVLGHGWHENKTASLVGRFEWTNDSANPNVKPVGWLDYDGFSEQIWKKSQEIGFKDKSLIKLIDENTWEQFARGTHNRKSFVTGDASKPTDFNLKGAAGERFGLSKSDILRNFPLDLSGYGMIASAGNFSELTDSNMRRDMNITSPSDEEKELYGSFQKNDLRVIKGAIASLELKQGDFTILNGNATDITILAYAANMSCRTPSPYPQYKNTHMTTRARVLFPEDMGKQKTVPSSPPVVGQAPPNPPETRTVEPPKK